MIKYKVIKSWTPIYPNKSYKPFVCNGFAWYVIGIVTENGSEYVDTMRLFKTREMARIACKLLQNRFRESGTRLSQNERI